MADGIKVWDASGNLTFDGTTRISRVLGTISVAQGTSGSLSDAGFATGTPYCVASRTNATPTSFGGANTGPIISFAGTTMFYDLANPTGDHLLIYGVY